MLALTTSTGRTYQLDLSPIPPVLPLPQKRHEAFVVALTNSAEDDADILLFSTLTYATSTAADLLAWQRIGATHYGVINEVLPEPEARTVAVDLGQQYYVPVRG